MSKNKKRILIVEDEADVLKINARMFARRGYNVLSAQNCHEAFSVLEEEMPDLLILDIMLPDGSGYDICRSFRLTSDNPVIFLTGKGEVSDKIEGLSQGGDYYLTKPYDLDELLAVAKRLIERNTQMKPAIPDAVVINKGMMTIDTTNKKVLIDGKDALVTSKEYALLMLLVNNEDNPVSAGILYENIWGAPSGGDTRTVRFHVTNLRKKINADNSDDYDIVSVYGKGYMFTCTR